MPGGQVIQVQGKGRDTPFYKIFAVEINFKTAEASWGPKLALPIIKISFKT